MGNDKAAPLISVIVPVYKVEEYLDKCVRSIVQQTYKNLEIILVDDGSPDRCPAMCEAWASKDARIKVIHKCNGGQASARNAGLNIARGSYIGFVDSDDYIAADMYGLLLQAIEDTGRGIACCGAQLVSDGGESIGRNPVPNKRDLNVCEALDAVFYLRADVSVWSKLYARDVLDHLRFPEGESNEDFPLIVPAIAKANGMVHVQKYLYYYRQHTGSITNSGCLTEEKSMLVYNNLQKIKNQLIQRKIGCWNSYRFFAAQFAFYHALMAEKKRDLLSEQVKKDNSLYRKIMKDNAIPFLFSRYSCLKDKVLYCLVLTKILRPLYRAFYRSHL